jgi:hypothetical protein
LVFVWYDRKPLYGHHPVEYTTFTEACKFFDRELFGGRLPPVLITLQRQANSCGYFSPDRFDERSSPSSIKESVGELALNPDRFANASDEEILSTMVHEMAHVWQEARGY